VTRCEDAIPQIDASNYYVSSKGLFKALPNLRFDVILRRTLGFLKISTI
jgi:hypothetical protein